jgi:hypothetical protein
MESMRDTEVLVLRYLVGGKKEVVINLECHVVLLILRLHIKVDIVTPLPPPCGRNQVLLFTRPPEVSFIHEAPIFFSDLCLNNLPLLMWGQILA